MSSMRVLLPVIILSASGLAGAMTLDDLVPGKTVAGPELSLAEMKGKVVFVEYWGTH